MTVTTFSPEVIEAALDGDLQLFMEKIPHSTTPREAVTIHDMEVYYSIMGDGENE